MKPATAILGCLFLTACATSAPVVKTVEVRVPVPVTCVPKLGAKPAYPDSDLAIMQADNLIDLAKLYRGGRALRMAWEAELEAALAGCGG